MLSVIIPTYNSADALQPLLKQLSVGVDDCVVSDGGSGDETLAIAVKYAARMAIGRAGRGAQLSRGARWSLSRSADDWLLCLHADSQLPDNWRSCIETHMRDHPTTAAYFGFKLDARGMRPRIIEIGAALRCAVLALPYGDQGLLIRRDHYVAIGGYAPDKPLFEDVSIVRAIGRARLRRLPAALTTSAHKYRRDGYMNRAVSNLILLSRFLRGAKASDLAQSYR